MAAILFHLVGATGVVLGLAIYFFTRDLADAAVLAWTGGSMICFAHCVSELNAIRSYLHAAEVRAVEAEVDG